MSFFSILPDTFSFSFLQFVREGAHQHSVALECVCFSRSLKGEATLMSVASSRSSRRKTNTQRLCTFCLNAWNKVPSCLQQGWGNNVFYNKLSHVLTHSHFQSNYPVVMLVFAPAVSDISPFHLFTHRYVYLENHFRARQNRSTGNPTLHQDTTTNVWSALIALRDKSLLSRAAVLFHTKLQLTV